MLAVPPSVLSDDWREPVPAATTARWSLGILLGAPPLEKLIAEGKANNADLAGARARLDQAVALLRIARKSTLPLVTAGATPSATNYLTKAFDFSGSAVSVDVTISPDLFGQESAKKRAAAARVTASHNDVE
ncbi:TolC family protein, partial [Sphingomonas sp.]|uniref:TolC family protein n=1 Tax=Sphingomonas sp. TaxID=28214 RepID=UPI003F823B72